MGALLLALATAPASAVAQPAEPAPDQPETAPRPAAPAEAAPAETPPAPADGDDDGEDSAAGTGDVLPLSEDDLAAIEAALGADAATRAESQPASARGLGGELGAAVQSMNPDIALIVDVALAWFSDDEPLQTGAHDPTATGFNLQQVELSLEKTVDPYFHVDANLVFAEFGVEVEEVYASTLALPYNLQARIGQFLTRIGRVNQTHPHTWDFVDQPLVIGKFLGAEGNRGLGFELSYLTPLPWYVEVLGSITDAAGEATARSFYGPQNLGVSSPRDFQSTAAIKQFFDLSPNWSLLWGLSVATGPNPTGHDNRSDIWGTDLYLKYRPITRASYTSVALQAEWYLRRRQVPRDLLVDHGGYAQVVWRFARRWATGARYEYVSAADDTRGTGAEDYLDPEWTEGRHRAAANVTFWPTEFSRIRLQGSVDAPGWRDDPIGALVLGFEFLIGAHGAHQF